MALRGTSQASTPILWPCFWDLLMFFKLCLNGLMIMLWPKPIMIFWGGGRLRPKTQTWIIFYIILMLAWHAATSVGDYPVCRYLIPHKSGTRRSLNWQIKILSPTRAIYERLLLVWAIEEWLRMTMGDDSQSTILSAFHPSCSYTINYSFYNFTKRLAKCVAGWQRCKPSLSICLFYWFWMPDASRWRASLHQPLPEISPAPKRDS
jgi:hypothetical protein